MSQTALQDIERLEDSLWAAADNLRANSKLTSSEYCMPVLGMIFLRHATNRYDAACREIEADRVVVNDGIGNPLACPLDALALRPPEALGQPQFARRVRHRRSLVSRVVILRNGDPRQQWRNGGGGAMAFR